MIDLITAKVLVGGMILALVWVAYQLGRMNERITQHFGPPDAKLSKSKPTPEPEGALFRDQMEAKPKEERVKTT